MWDIVLQFNDYLEEQLYYEQMYYDDEYHRQCNMHQVSHDMAVDAGDLSLEGTWI